jgi:hypothetical protein
MPLLRYWSFPVTNGMAAVIITSASHTGISLVELELLPHFLAQLECARSFSHAVKFND